jgi:hypothetical protein
MNDELQTISGPGEVTRLTCAGGGSPAFAAKIKSNVAYNIYKVRMIEILAEGQAPAEIGGEMNAVNLAEDFTQQGQLPAGRYVLVCSTGGRNVFYAEP